MLSLSNFILVSFAIANIRDNTCVKDSVPQDQPDDHADEQLHGVGHGNLDRSIVTIYDKKIEIVTLTNIAR